MASSNHTSRGRHLKRLSLVTSPNRKSFPLSPLATTSLVLSPADSLPASPKTPSLVRSNTLPRSARLVRSESHVDSEHSDDSSATNAGTLVEQNADLLTVIAKKERKCLDLREELKKNEVELEGLKKQWQTIVSSTLTYPSTRREESTSAVSQKGNRPSTSIYTSYQLPSPGPSRSPSIPKTLLDCSNEHHDTAALDDPKTWSDKANQAKMWVGGVVVKVLDGLDAVAPPNHVDLPIVPEEPEDDTSIEKCSSSTSRVLNSKRTSTASTETSSSFGFHGHYNSDSVSSSQTSPDEDIFVPIAKPSQFRTIGTLKAGPGITATPTAHTRRKSTLDASLLYSGVNLVGKKLAEINNSETFKTSRKALIGSIESLEGLLIDAMVPPSPHNGQPASSELHRTSSLTRNSSAIAQRQSSSRRHNKTVSTSHNHNTSRSPDSNEWGEWAAW